MSVPLLLAGWGWGRSTRKQAGKPPELQKWLCAECALAPLFQQESPARALGWDRWPGRRCTLGTPEFGEVCVGLIVGTFCSVSLRGVRTKVHSGTAGLCRDQGSWSCRNQPNCSSPIVSVFESRDAHLGTSAAVTLEMLLAVSGWGQGCCPNPMVPKSPSQ